MAKSNLDLTKYPKKGENPKRKLGRPTKYKPEFAQLLLEHFSIPATTEKEVVYTNKKGETWSKMETVATDLPTFEEFAESIGVDDRTLENWFKAKRSNGSPRFPNFFRAYMRAKQMQRNILIKNALAGRYNPAYSIFLSKNVTDMREKVEVPTDDKGNPIPVVSGFQFIVPTDKDGKNNDNPRN